MKDSLRKEKEDIESSKIIIIATVEGEKEDVGDPKKEKMIDRKLRLCRLAKRVVTPTISVVFISVYWVVGIYQFYFPNI